MTTRKVNKLSAEVATSLANTVEAGSKAESVRSEFFKVCKSKGYKVTVFISPKKEHSTSTAAFHSAVKSVIATKLFSEPRWSECEQLMQIERKDLVGDQGAKRTRFNQKVGEVITQLHIGYAAFLGVDKSTGLDKSKAKKLKETEVRKASEEARKEAEEELNVELVTTDDAQINKFVKELSAIALRAKKHEVAEDSKYKGSITNGIYHVSEAIKAFLG